MHIVTVDEIFVEESAALSLLRACACRKAYCQCPTPNLPTNIVPTNIARVKISGKFPMGLGIPPL